MKNFNEMTVEERKEISELFYNWLCRYSNEVVRKVMARYDEIASNDFAMNMLRELKRREEKEKKDEIDSIARLITDYEDFAQYDIHNHPLEHSGSYRDILHDMYIR